ncbi:uncharacterized protein SCODWIG_01789 [Saccharomycodes ludwigii]|uniref:Symplekin/Pta1 N-terminal domain-containing protein n=1 Tax=Saccharomycodes ludwigii TaxID=36035 RepID=A0A376B5Q3_9ASCO|nr:hypothetical protein SCDLUD_003350 [Saccharomycodes ludwigii]KAH3900375.1 hypothetical protein SCDLUD_003350 [Saccharomycodes ludwigii]SSD60028.1 uncharacterized protein SCODWIG_01789 [Saccharomycodes ludwigii]
MPVNQLQKARELALTSSNPELALVQVLDTTFQLISSANTNTVNSTLGFESNSNNTDDNIDLFKFGTSLFVDVLYHSSIKDTEKPFIVSKHLNTLITVCRNYNNSTNYNDKLLYCLSDVTVVIAYTYEGLFDLVAKTSNSQIWDLLTGFQKLLLETWNNLTNTRIHVNNIINISKNYDELLNPFKFHSRDVRLKCNIVRYFSKIIVVHTNGKGCSIGAIPNNHPVIQPKQTIEMLGRKFLDILLNYLVDDEIMLNTPVFQAILNCLVFIMQQRPQSCIRIFNSILKFNIDLKYQQLDESALQFRLSKRFIERSYKNFVNFVIRNGILTKSLANGTLYSKLSKIAATLNVIGEETKSKGILNFDSSQFEKNKLPTKIVSKYAKSKEYIYLLRLRDFLKSESNVNSDVTGNIIPISEDSLVGLYNSIGLKKHGYAFDLSCLSKGMLIKLSTDVISNKNNSSKIVQRLTDLATVYAQKTTEYISLNSAVNINTTSTNINNKRKWEQEDGPKKKESKKNNHLVAKGTHPKQEVEKKEDADEDDEDDDYTPDVPLKREKIDDVNRNSQYLTKKEKIEHVGDIVDNIIELSKDDTSDTANNNVVSNNSTRLSQWNHKGSWITILSRLSSRGLTEKEDDFANVIRNKLYEYFIQDFANRIDVVVEWMNEEWFGIQLRSQSKDKIQVPDYYSKWSNKIFDGLIPFIDNTHRRQFIRLISELPSLDNTHLQHIKSLCKDPSRSQLGFQSLKFLIMFRPPLKSLIHEFLKDLMGQHPDLKEQCESIIKKFY